MYIYGKQGTHVCLLYSVIPLGAHQADGDSSVQCYTSISVGTDPYQWCSAFGEH